MTSMPTITDADTDPATIFAATGAAESHAVMSVLNAAGSQPTINVVTAGSHELLSTSTITDNSFKAVVRGDLVLEEWVEPVRAGTLKFKAHHGGWAEGYAKANYDQEIKFAGSSTVENKDDGAAASFMASVGLALATVILATF